MQVGRKHSISATGSFLQLQKIRDGFGQDRLTVQKTLHLMTALFQQEVALLGILHAFSDDFESASDTLWSLISSSFISSLCSSIRT